MDAHERRVREFWKKKREVVEQRIDLIRVRLNTANPADIPGLVRLELELMGELHAIEERLSPKRVTA